MAQCCDGCCADCIKLYEDGKRLPSSVKVMCCSSRELKDIVHVQEHQIS